MCSYHDLRFILIINMLSMINWEKCGVYNNFCLFRIICIMYLYICAPHINWVPWNWFLIWLAVHLIIEHFYSKRGDVFPWSGQKTIIIYNPACHGGVLIFPWLSIHAIIYVYIYQKQYTAKTAKCLGFLLNIHKLIKEIHLLQFG